MNCTLIAINCRHTHSCLALFHVRRELRRHLPGSRCRLLVRTINDPYYDILLDILDDNGVAPEALFFSVYVWNAILVERLVGDIRALYPQMPIVLGGPEVSHGRLRDGFAGCVVAAGEVEGLAPAFYQDLALGRLLPEYRATPAAEFPMPYEEDDFAGPLAGRSIYYESSRGCPYSCSYCLSSVERGVRHKPLDLVMEELAWLIARRPRTIRFVDRTFNDRPERAMAIWRFLLAAGGDAVCHFEIAPELFTEEMFGLLADVPEGRFQFEIGIQSTNPATLAAIRRKMDFGRAAANIRRLLALGSIHIHLDLILGLPHEDRDSFGRSFNAVFALGPHYIQMGLLKLLPGTVIAEGRGREFTACAEPPYEVLATAWLDHAALARLHRLGEVVESFCNSRFFSTVIGYVRRSEADPFALFDRLLDVCQRHDFFALARNQEKLSLIFSDFIEGRSDAGLIFELLRYDWLLSGQRSLPPHLRAEGDRDLTRRVRLSLPQNLPPYYSYRERDEFIRRAMFLEMSPKAMAEAGLGPKAGFVCLMPAADGRLHGMKRAVVLDLS